MNNDLQRNAICYTPSNVQSFANPRPSLKEPSGKATLADIRGDNTQSCLSGPIVKARHHAAYSVLCLQDAFVLQGLNSLVRPLLTAPKRFDRVDALRSIELLWRGRYLLDDRLNASKVDFGYSANAGLCDKRGRVLGPLGCLVTERHASLDISSHLEDVSREVAVRLDEDCMVVSWRTDVGDQINRMRHSGGDGKGSLN